MRAVAVIALAAVVIAFVIGQCRREVREQRARAARNHPSRADSLPVARGFAAGDAAYLADHPGDLDNWTDYLPADPGAPVYTDLLATYEAARADWTIPQEWSQP